MKYEVVGIQKVGVKSSAEAMNKTVQDMANDGWTVQQILGSPDQGYVILFAKEN